MPGPVTRSFPGSLPLPVFLSATTGWLRDTGFAPDQALAIVAACRDEIVGDLRGQVRRHWHRSFDFSSLSGIPLAGVTGARAALDHAPSSGTTRQVVVFGLPHIGILADGTVGQVLRRGRAEPSTACGSLIASVQWAQRVAGDPAADPNELDPMDPEQSLVRSHLLRFVPDLAGLDPVAVVEQTCEVIRVGLWQLQRHITADEPVELAVVTGILVHGPDDEDYVAPRTALLGRDDMTEALDLAAIIDRVR